MPQSSLNKASRSAFSIGLGARMDTMADVLGWLAVKPLRSGIANQLISAGAPNWRSVKALIFARSVAAVSA